MDPTGPAEINLGFARRAAESIRVTERQDRGRYNGANRVLRSRPTSHMQGVFSIQVTDVPSADRPGFYPAVMQTMDWRPPDDTHDDPFAEWTNGPDCWAIANDPAGMPTPPETLTVEASYIGVLLDVDFDTGKPIFGVQGGEKDAEDRLVGRCLVRATYRGPVMGEREVYEEAARPGYTYCVDVGDCPACDSDYGYSPPPPPPPPGDVTVTVVRTGGPPPDVTFTPDVVDSAGTHHTPGASVGTVTVGGLPGGSGYAVLSSIAGGPWGTPTWTFYPAVGTGPSGSGTVGAFTVSGSGGVLVFTLPPA